jgi:3-hydroxyisobutyrate dehydrogenase-like beta-hydroxyacid dehydrogenase
MSTIGFIGLGAMGSGMARNVASKHDGPVHVFDMKSDAVDALVSAGALPATSVAYIATVCDLVFLSLPGGTQVASVCADIACHAVADTTIVDLSTTSVAEARSIHADLLAKGIAFADAPVARARSAAEAGTLSIMVGASEPLFARIEPLLRYMGTDINRCGEIGCGQVVKLINNSLLFVHVAALAEMMVAGERAGVSNQTLLDVLSISSADSFALRNHGMKAMLPRDFPEKAFPMDYTTKDMGYALELAQQAGVDPKLAKLAASYYQQGIDVGIGSKYFPAIIGLIEEVGK